jgi:hypothetical protein
MQLLHTAIIVTQHHQHRATAQSSPVTQPHSLAVAECIGVAATVLCPGSWSGFLGGKNLFNSAGTAAAAHNALQQLPAHAAVRHNSPACMHAASYSHRCDSLSTPPATAAATVAAAAAAAGAVGSRTLAVRSMLPKEQTSYVCFLVVLIL